MPSASIYRLLYISTASHEMSDAELNEILEPARAFNAANNISGMLLYVERQFVQYLEGNPFVVRSLYRRIEQDPRHTGVMRLLWSEVPRRVFADWSMGFKHVDQSAAQPIEGAIDLCRRSLREAIPPEAPGEIVTFMESFYRTGQGLRDFG